MLFVDLLTRPGHQGEALREPRLRHHLRISIILLLRQHGPKVFPRYASLPDCDAFTEKLRFFLTFCFACRYAAFMDNMSDIFSDSPDGFHVRNVTVRLARPDERRRWDRLMNQHHHLVFKRFAGRGIRYVFEWRDHWVGLADWQSGAFRCRPRDEWIGWKSELQFTRMHLIANNSRLLILGAPECFPNLDSFALAAMVRRLSDDWSAAYGHSLLLAETFVDSSKSCGHMYKAAGWTELGCTKGYARANGRYTDPRGIPKDLYAFSLHRDTRHRICAPDPLPGPLLPNPMGCASEPPSDRLKFLYDEFLPVPDFRRAQDRKHAIASVLAIIIAASISGFETGIAAAQFARALNQTELESLGAWFNPKTKQYEPPSKSVIYRVLQMADQAENEAVLKCWAASRVDLEAALAADGKRLRGANRNGDDYFETATLVAHDTGLPVASHGFHDKNGERAAVRALFEEVPLDGHVITVDALHTTRDTARSIVETHNADYLMTVKENTPKTHETLSTINWNSETTGAFEEEITKAHGRIECRRIQTMTPQRGRVNFPHLAQVFRIERDRGPCKSGKKSTEIVYGITSVPEDRGTPEKLLAWNRGHWSVENRNHWMRDVNFKEDASRSRTMHGPTNRAICNNIALALIFSRRPKVAETRRHFNLNCHEVSIGIQL